ncbi:MAG: bifunctional UDP-N-acetylglucosamine diphosphorylase/glucosamine-1-phosphate N-acetyltransferase GlmU [Clostridia bacterium]
MNKVAVIILAAGKGTRMYSKVAKVLHQVANMPMLGHVLTQVEQVDGVEQKIVVVGHQGEDLLELLEGVAEVAWQREQLGTGHAVQQALGLLHENVDDVLVVCGDTPLLTAKTLNLLLKFHLAEKASATVLSALFDDSSGYGRIIRDENDNLMKIIEQKDATDREKLIKEINSGVYVFNAQELKAYLSEIKANNAQNEYYLTDIISVLRRESKLVKAFITKEADDIMGINNRIQLAEAEKLMRKRINNSWMEKGVTMVDPDSVYIDASVLLSQDVWIGQNTIVQGNTVVAEGVRLGPNTIIKDSLLGADTFVEQSTVLNSKIGCKCSIGPYAYIRPDCLLADNVKVGDFSELKNTIVAEGSKIPHLSYIGDAEIGSKVNVGAGTITCNYDGKNKFKTVIGDGAFIGSNTNLVAPVVVARKAYIAAGSTIVEDVPEEALGIARGKQRNIEGWASKK